MDGWMDGWMDGTWKSCSIVSLHYITLVLILIPLMNGACYACMDNGEISSFHAWREHVHGRGEDGIRMCMRHSHVLKQYNANHAEQTERIWL